MDIAYRFETAIWPPRKRSIHLGGGSNEGVKCLSQERNTMTAGLKPGPLDPSPTFILLGHRVSLPMQTLLNLAPC